MTNDVAQFTFLALAAIGFFAFMTVSSWINTVANERRERDRLALLKRTIEQSPDAVERLRELLREEDARVQEHARREALRARRGWLQIGVIIVAFGVGASSFLALVSPRRPVWSLGIIFVLVGLVMAGFAFFEKPETAEKG